MSDKQRQWGQFYTAPEVVDLILGFCLRRPGDRLLDPSCGQGAFLVRAARYQRWLTSNGATNPDNTLGGVEIDPAAAEVAQDALAVDGAPVELVTQDFFSLRPGDGLPESFDCVVGNPPYTRSEWLGKVSDDGDYKPRLAERAGAALDGEPVVHLGRRSGLHAYFFVHGFKFLRPGGRFGFVVSNSWLDVDYGGRLKQFLLDHYKIVAIIESAVERWFSEASVNTCLVILERCDDPADRALNQVRFARLRRPLNDFLHREPDDPERSVRVENLVMRLMPGRSRLEGDIFVRVMPQGGLQAARKWGPYLRAPEIYFQTRSGGGTVELGELVVLRRGVPTGANRFFYLSPAQVQQWEIEPEYIRPLLKSPKEIEMLNVSAKELQQRILAGPQQASALAETKVLQYIQWGESQGVHRRATCSRRPQWYSLPRWENTPARLAWPKGIWNRHFVGMLDQEVVVDQQFYELAVVPAMAKALAAVLNSTWVALQCELLGRSNFGEGVLWLAAYEVLQVRLPDLNQLSDTDRDTLARSFQALSEAPVRPLAERVLWPEQQALDDQVGEMLSLSPSERTALVEAAVELTDTRIRRATGRPA